jgi:hypothetical protein
VIQLSNSVTGNIADFKTITFEELLRVPPVALYRHSLPGLRPKSMP